MDQVQVLLRSGEQLIIRHAQQSDAPMINAYLRQVADETTFLSFDSSEWTKSDEEEASSIQDYIDTENMVYYIAMIDDAIVAHINASGSHKKRLCHNVVFGLSVVEMHWHKGIATILINELIGWSRSNPIVKKISLMVSDQNKRAIRLYEKFGFEHEGRLRNDNYVNGAYYDGLCMGMWLG